MRSDKREKKLVNLLIRIFVKDYENTTNPKVRGAYGTLCSIVGIVLNALLFAGKFFAGTISNSVSITADAFNNLSDAGSSVITLLGFKLAGQEPDPEKVTAMVTEVQNRVAYSSTILDYDYYRILFNYDYYKLMQNVPSKTELSP